MGKGKKKGKDDDDDLEAEMDAIAQEVLAGVSAGIPAAAAGEALVKSKHAATDDALKVGAESSVASAGQKANKKKSGKDGEDATNNQSLLTVEKPSHGIESTAEASEKSSKNKNNKVLAGDEHRVVPKSVALLAASNDKKSVDINKTDVNQNTTSTTDAPEALAKKGKKEKKSNVVDDDDEQHAADNISVSAVNAAKSKLPSVAPASKSAEVIPLDEDEDDGVGLKTAAQKRQEKKEREREERMKQHAKQRARAEREEALQSSTGEHPESTAAGSRNQESNEKFETAEAGETKSVGAHTADAVLADSHGKETGKHVQGKAPEAGARKGLPTKAVQAMQERLRLIKEQEERVQREEEERIKREEEAEQLRLQKFAEAEELKKKKKEKDKLRRERLKAEGKPVTAKQKADLARAKAFIEQMRAQGVSVPQIGEKVDRLANKAKKKIVDGSTIDGAAGPDQHNEQQVPAEDAESISDSVATDDAVDDWEDHAASAGEETPSLVKKIDSTVISDASSIPIATLIPSKPVVKKSNLRSPVVCVLGHVDTGKTKILDYIRKTHVQDSEAGGITQQIGATEVPLDAIRKQAAMVREFASKEIRVGGMLIIDTPGHEAFTNLRSRGSSMCDIAILVVDLMHGLEQQTIESINLLKSRKTPFIVALNKVDRLYQWKSMNQSDIRDALDAQAANTKSEFRKRVDEVIAEFAAQELNVRLFHENPNPREFISAVPTSAHSGDGMGNLIALLVELSQMFLVKRLTISEDLHCTVMEVKVLPGLGTTIDVILINGTLRLNNKIVVAGQEGPIVTTIKGLLMPQPLRELRVRNEYMTFEEVTGAQGLKVMAKDLEKAVAGLPLLVAKNDEEVEVHKKELQKQLSAVLKSINVSDRGVYVQASTIGSLEALLEFLRTSKIAYCGINIGPVHKADVRRAAVMLEHNPKYAAVLAFDVRIDKDAQQLADELKVKIFSADIIYHLFDSWTKYTDELRQQAKDEHRNKVVFPCRLRILPDHVYGRRDPIIVGVRVESGRLRLRTPICVPSKEMLDIGVVSSIESNHQQRDEAKAGDEVCIRIDNASGSVPKLFGRHFDEQDMLVSKISRESIDLIKEYFRDEMDKADWQLIIELKKELDIF